MLDFIMRESCDDYCFIDHITVFKMRTRLSNTDFKRVVALQ